MEQLFITKEQEAILELQKAYQNSGICNVGGIVKLSGNENFAVALKAFKYTIEHIPVIHIQMNTKYQPYFSDEEILWQAWEKKEKPSIEELSIWLKRPFVFFNGPLCECRYYVNEKVIEFYIKVHHLLLDGYSIALIIRRFSQVYTEMKEGKQPKEEENYKCFSEIYRPTVISERDLTWLHGVDFPKEPEQWKMKKAVYGNIEASHQMYHIPQELYEHMERYEKENGISKEVCFTTALGVYISKIMGSETVAIGRSMMNRRKKDMDVLGMRVNTLPILMKIRKEDTFLNLCKQVKAFFFEMMCHSSAPFQEYMEKEQMNGPYYDVSISYRNENMIPFMDGMEQKEIPGKELELPMRIFINEFSEDVRIEIQYQSGCYTKQEIQAFWERITNVLEQGINQKTVKDISVLSKQDCLKWEELNKNEQKELPKIMVPDRIKNQAKCQGNEKVAVVFENNQMSYKELEEKAYKLANWLLEEGVLPGDVVGIQIKSSLLLPVAFYGVWKAGAAFLPIGINETEMRKRKMIHNCKKVLTEMEVEIGSLCESEAILPQIQPDMIAYYMYTSGSTGEPKAVMISHQSLICRLVWMQEIYGCANSVLQKAAYTFDVSMWEYFLPLIEGGTLFLAKEEERGNPKYLLKILKKHQIETVHFVPSLLGVFLKYAEKLNIEVSSLRHIFSSGEALSTELVKQCYKLFPQVKLHNLYGPTECTIDVTSYDCVGEEKEIPIGKPIFWTKAEVIGKDGICLPPGIEGELSIRGYLVGEGYFHETSGGYRRDQITMEKIYDTGDRAVLGLDGMLYYKGRSDRQCKINGIRVDLGQIESVMLQCPGVLYAVAIKKENSLVGFYMARTPIPELGEKMKETLPVYSIPQKLVYMKEIQLTNNGKMDKKYLEQCLENEELVLPQNREEKILHKYLEKKLGHCLSVEENLFLAGLDSLLLMDVILELEEYGHYYSVEDFYQNLSIKNIVLNAGTGYQWLRKKKSKNLVLAFPYAAGTANAYKPLSKELESLGIDICVVRNAEKLPELTEYSNIVLLGYCTGTVTALKALKEMHKKGKEVSGIILCAALPPGEVLKRIGSPWKKMTNWEIGRMLDYLHGKPMHTSKSMIECFRRDTDEFFAFFHQKYHMKCPKISLFFGGKDPLTRLSWKKWKRWTEYLSGVVKVHIWQQEGHFFVEQRCKELADQIYRMVDKRKE